MADTFPALHVEPPIPSPTEYASVSTIRAAVVRHDDGYLYEGAVLFERMLWNPRVYSVMQTRVNGLIATEIRWEPARQNRDGRRAAEAMREDWPWMAPAPARRQMAQWGLGLGFGLAQRVPLDSPTSGRTLFRLQPYWPGWAQWYWPAQVYRIRTYLEGYEHVGSPTLGVAVDAATSPWVLHEPFGVHSWRHGLIHPFWFSWFGHDRATRDGFRAAEKFGLGILKAMYPQGAGKPDASGNGGTGLATYLRGLRSLGKESVIPCERDGDGNLRYDVAPLEFTGGSGIQAISEARNAAAVDLAVAGLGHNLTTEVKGGSYAAANVGEYIRGDLKTFDAAAEHATYGPQLAQPWALLNFGDPELAPIAVAITDPPAVNQAAAQTYASLATAMTQLKQFVPSVDLEALAERFRMPLRTQVQVPRAEPDEPDEPDEPEAEPSPAEPRHDASDAPPARAADPAAPAEESGAKATLALTPSDIASIVRVDEARTNIDLPAVGGETGGLWVREHSSRLTAKLPATDQPNVAPENQNAALAAIVEMEGIIALAGQDREAAEDAAHEFVERIRRGV